MLAADRFLAPGYKAGATTNADDRKETTKTKTRKAVSMGISIIRELAKSALVVALFNTVGISALSL